jgi:hypothetical protein
MGERRKWGNKELSNLYSSPDTVKAVKLGMMRCDEHMCGRCGIHTVQNFGQKMSKEITTWKIGVNCEDAIKMDQKTIMCEGMDDSG